MCRRGFVLLAVLWVMVGVSALGLALALSARNAIRGAENRRASEIAAWRAEGCAERARAVIAAALSGAHDVRSMNVAAPSSPPLGGWRTLDQVVADSPLMRSSGCAVTLRAAGSAIDVNAASEELLHDFLTALIPSSDRADSLTDAILDWRDPDDVPRPLGAERGWYEQAGRIVPGNGPLSNVRELRLVRSFDAIGGLDTLFDVEPGRIDLGHAPLAVLAALPGFTSEAVGRVAEERMRGVPATDLLALSARLSPTARATLVSRYADLARMTVTEPDAWILESRSSAGARTITDVVELRLVRAGARAAIVRKRSWVE
jgi:type II secretory pathway component PulK